MVISLENLALPSLEFSYTVGFTILLIGRGGTGINILYYRLADPNILHLWWKQHKTMKFTKVFT